MSISLGKPLSSDAASGIASAPSPSYILTVSCSDKPGIVHSLTGVLASNGLNILQSAQFGDPLTNRFFLRVHFAPSTASPNAPQDVNALESLLSEVCNQLDDATWKVVDARDKLKVVIMVSKIGHCLSSLLFSHRSGALPIDIPLVISNHPDYKSMCENAGIPFAHIPVTKETKPEAEEQQLKLIQQSGADLVVMARYMQVLTANFVKNAPPVINVHHALLPAFKGGKPYFQAHDRGVKFVGATAHYASADLDEGPIIEQDVERVNHGFSPKDLTQVGAHVECQVLERAVKWFAEQRILLNGHKTVVFA